MAINIRPEVDETDIDMAISKLKMAITLQGQLGTGVRGRSPRGLMKEWTDLERTWSKMVATDPTMLARFATMDLPTVNREMRVLLGYVPGARVALQYYFRLLRLQRGVEKAIGPTATMGPLFLTIIATTLLILSQIQKAHKQWERQVRSDRADYENMFREGMDLTHAEWVNIGEAQRGFATWGQQFADMMERMTTIEAVAKAIGNWWAWFSELDLGPGWDYEIPPYDFQEFNTE